MNNDVEKAWAELPRKGCREPTCLAVAIAGGIGVALLALIPLFMPPKESARRAACPNNLKQLGMALGSYAENCGGRLPATLETLLGEGYLPDSGPLYCPYRKECAEAFEWAREALDVAHRNGLNPKDTADAVRAAAPSHYIYVQYETVEDMLGAPVVYDEPRNHKGRRNVLFGDGNVEPILEKDLARRFAEEAERVPAFKEYLEKHGIDGAEP